MSTQKVKETITIEKSEFISLLKAVKAGKSKATLQSVTDPEFIESC